MEPRVIKSEEDYETALAEVERLIALDPAPGTPQADRLELFSTLVETYEIEKFPFEQPDPVDAILFRMEEQGLKQKDLVPFIGSRSRVSEVLARKRQLTVQMIQALSEGLGISARVLVQGTEAKEKNNGVSRAKRQNSDLQKSYKAKKEFLPPKIVEKGIYAEIPITLSMLVGDIVIRFGRLERIIFTAMARVQCTDEGKGNDQSRFYDLLGEYKMIQPLGKLLNKAQQLFENRKFKWIDFRVLGNLKDRRNAIHDALMEEPDGTLIWQASGGRKHRQLDYAELLLLREAVVRTIREIDEGSFQYKKGA